MSSCLTSVSFYEEKLGPRINAAINSEIFLEEVVAKAEALICEKFTPDSRRLFTHRNGSSQSSVELDKVMIAMLTYAEECGGKDGKRYVASAIVACSEEKDDVQALVALGTTWLTHLLFVFKANSSHPYTIPSELATPTANETSKRKTSFAKDVKLRDGYICVVTGFQDYSRPNPSRNNFRIRLEAAHILRRAIGEFDSDHESNSFKSALTTFDSLTNFSRLSVKTLEELRDELDSPSNGLTLEPNAHNAFDSYMWCLKPTEQPNIYQIKTFDEDILIRRPPNDLVSFVDNAVSDSTGTGKRSRPVDSPNPNYFAIHAAIAGVLNMSGAGRFFDELLTKYKDDEGNPPAVRCWSEMEEWMYHTMLTESVYDAFQSVQIFCSL